MLKFLNFTVVCLDTLGYGKKFVNQQAPNHMLSDNDEERGSQQMSSYRLLKHKDFEASARDLPQSVKQKALWAQVMLGTRGRTPRVKGTTGSNARWRRTPVQGNHYYMWWIPTSESTVSAADLPHANPTNNGHAVPDQGDAHLGKNGTSPLPDRFTGQSILIHSIRHHDETDTPLDPGSLLDYEEIPIADLDPRFDEQRRVSQRVVSDDVALSTIKGLPGSGKTVSLFYLVKDLVQGAAQQEVRPTTHSASIDASETVTADGEIADNTILYVTYTSRLKRAAQEFIHAQGEDVRARVKVVTLNEIESQLTGLDTHTDPFMELARFDRFLNAQKSGSLGLWRKYPRALYTEVRAQLLGRQFPKGYVPGGESAHQVSARLRNLSVLDADAYATSRSLPLEDAQVANRIAVGAQRNGFFQDQQAARRALAMLMQGETPAWLSQLDALIVDEIQDLTLVQIAFLGELARTRIAANNDASFVFTVAGDESQIVQPSGFDWGVTKELLGEILGTWPDEFEFRHQRRAPRNLAQLIDNTWGFYGNLARQHRPSARRQSYADLNLVDRDGPGTASTEEVGRIQICVMDEGGQPARVQNNGLAAQVRQETVAMALDWHTLLEELAEKPGRALIDLTETLHDEIAVSTLEQGEEILFLPREIKGLERTTVLVHGLNTLYARALQFIHDDVGNDIPKFEARRLFDEMRVALSRSTANLVLLERRDAAVLTMLGLAATTTDISEREIDDVEFITPTELLEVLRVEEMSEIEVIEGYLDEVDDLFERGRWALGYRRNRRAHTMAVQLGDLALQRETQEQLVNGHLQEAATLLADGDWTAANRRHARARTLAIDFADPFILDRVAEQQQKLVQNVADQVAQLLGQSQEWADRRTFKVALDAARKAHTLAVMLNEIAPVDIQDGGEGQATTADLTLTDGKSPKTDAFFTSTLFADSPPDTTLIDEPVARTAEQAAEGAADAVPSQDDAEPKDEKVESWTPDALISHVDDRIADICWQWAYQLTSTDGPATASGLSQGNEVAANIQQAITLLDEAADVMTRQDNGAAAAAIRILAERYRHSPPTPASDEARFSEAQVRRILNAAQRYVDIMRPLDAEPAAFAFVERWLEETYQTLSDRVRLYYDWAITAQDFARNTLYPNYDDYMWDLENRFEMWYEGKSDARRHDRYVDRFHAFILAYNGEYAAASRIWEEMKEFAQAADLAREAGELVRAHSLMMQTRAEIPQALDTGVKIIALLNDLAAEYAELRAE